MTSAESIARSIDDASRSLLVREPYYGHLLVGTVRAVADGGFLARLAPAGQLVRLEVGSEGWEAAGPSARSAALKHELLHLTLKHPLRTREYASPDLWGLACDLVVNQLFDSSALEGAARLSDYSELGLEPDQSADTYYRALLPLYDTCRHGCSSCQGACSSSGSGAEAAMRRWLEEAACRTSHERWSGFAALPSPALSVMETNVDALVEATVRRACCRGWGPLPSNLVAKLERLVSRRAEVPWRRVIRLFGATSERTWLKNTLSRPSKRYGTSPGIRVKRRTRLVVAVDTSGSVREREIALFFSEVHGMWRRGAEVTILECDAEVQREYPYRGSLPTTVFGRGGTSFDPALRRANELKPDGLIYFTDGCAPAPEVTCRVPILWVVSRGGQEPGEIGHLPGRRVNLSLESR